MARPSEYDTCVCGARKVKTSARCRRCHYRRLRAARQAHRLVLMLVRRQRERRAA